jgi:hypothetical protein
MYAYIRARELGSSRESEQAGSFRSPRHAEKSGMMGGAGRPQGYGNRHPRGAGKKKDGET